jgi:hypothetical protein
LTDFIKVNVFLNGTNVNSENRDLLLINGADVDISLAIPGLTNGNINAAYTATYELFRRTLNSGETSVNFSTTIPNYVGYPEHKRC